MLFVLWFYHAATVARRLWHACAITALHGRWEGSSSRSSRFGGRTNRRWIVFRAMMLRATSQVVVGTLDRHGCGWPCDLLPASSPDTWDWDGNCRHGYRRARGSGGTRCNSGNRPGSPCGSRCHGLALAGSIGGCTEQADLAHVALKRRCLMFVVCLTVVGADIDDSCAFPRRSARWQVPIEAERHRALT